ncbi:MAG TPA: S41 family peptidase [Thermomicrobiales bacterium]|jgi:carboxyl-terminal processing protease|nr:S41 family peptidase [Thermomicrobiales bacterium]
MTGGSLDRDDDTRSSRDTNETENVPSGTEKNPPWDNRRWDEADDQDVHRIKNHGRKGDPLIRLLAGLAVVLIAMVAFLGGVFVERELVSRSGPIDDERLDEVAEIIQAEYYRGPTDDASQAAFEEQLEQGALEGIAAGAGDPYTAYLPPSDAAPLSTALSGQYGGIGVVVQQQDQRLVVTNVTPGGPAEEAGLRPGDVLVSVDDFQLAGVSVSDAGERIRGEVGTVATVVVDRIATGERLTFAAERERLETPVVDYRFDAETGIATISVAQFNATTTAQLDRSLILARADGATGLILDLRGNGGGTVTAAQEMIGRFVPAAQGPALYETVGRAGAAEDYVSLPIIGTPDGSVSDLPLVVVVDGNTASAAEIVAASLRDYGRAVVLGEPTFGKGSVQRIHEFDDRSILRVTIAEWLTPDRQRLNGVGVVIDVPVTGGPTPESEDAQLEAATAWLLSGGTSSATFGW